MADSEAGAMIDARNQLDGFIAKFSSANQSLIHEARTALRRLLPGTNELVYDNYNFFVIGYCPTERPSDCIVSIAASAKGVAISFYRGAELIDSKNILLGSGNQNRYIRFTSLAVLDDQRIVELIAQAASLGHAVDRTSESKLIVRSVSAKQRTRQ